MAFGRNGKPCKVYEYGCLPPVAGESELVEELHRRQQYWNTLVEIERDYRAKVREVLTLPNDPVIPLIEKLDAVRGQIKAARQAERKGTVDVAVLRHEAKELREAIAELRPAQKKARQELARAKKPILDELEQERRVRAKEARKQSGLYWCNYDDEEKHYNAARRAAMRSGTELRFRRWDGTGKVTVRYQTGLPVCDAFGANTCLQIEPVPTDAWEHPIRAVRRKAARSVIRLRVGSDKSRKPVWVELPIVLHRPMPPDGEIRAASIVRERVGRRYRHKAIITVALPDGEYANRPKPPAGVVAVDLGWRMVTDGLRVAYWHDDQGRHGQLVLGPEVLHEFSKLPDLRAIRDRHFNEIKGALGAWKAQAALPDWLVEELKTLVAWRSPGRLMSLIARWAENRFAGDEEIWKSLQRWRERENHLFDWEANLRDQVHRRRREIYRVFAADLVQKYRTIVLEKFDLRSIAQKPDAEDGTRSSLPGDRQRTIAAVSTLRDAINNAAGRMGCEVEVVDAKYSTAECHACGHVEKFDAAAQIWRTCPACGELWDQDHNAARVLMVRFLENNGGLAAER